MKQGRTVRFEGLCCLSLLAMVIGCGELLGRDEASLGDDGLVGGATSTGRGGTASSATYVGGALQAGGHANTPAAGGVTSGGTATVTLVPEATGGVVASAQGAAGGATGGAAASSGGAAVPPANAGASSAAGSAGVAAGGATGLVPCEPGKDWTCNDDPAISSIHGTCNSDGTCTCHAGIAVNAITGRCR